MSKKLYILDLSGFIFRAYFALPPMTNSKGLSTNALFGFIRSVLKLFKDFAPEHMVAVLDGPDNKKQRKEIYEKYKSHRGPIAADLPEQIEQAKKFCDLIGISKVELEGVEADDAIGSIAVWAARAGLEVVICTSDKDFAQLVNEKIHLLNPWKENLKVDRAKVEELFGVPPEKIIDLLALMGDASDNIPGVKGIGPKGAIELLTIFNSLEEIFAHPERIPSEKKRSLLLEQKEEALLSRRLATIHTELTFPQDNDYFKILPWDREGIRAFYQEMEFNSLLKEIEATLGLSTPEIPENTSYHIVKNVEELEGLLKKLRTASDIALHIETSSEDFMQADLLGLGFCVEEKEAYYLPLHRQEDAQILATLKPLLEDLQCSFFGHNIKFLKHLLYKAGITAPHFTFDTVLASYLLNSASRKHSLDHLALSYFGKTLLSLKSLTGSGKKEILLKDLPLEKLALHSFENVDYTFRLKKLLAHEVEKRGLSSLFYELELPLLDLLFKMEHQGIYLHVPYLEKYSKEIALEIAGIEKEIFELAGENFNLNSPKQLSQILFDKLKIKPLKKTATGLSTNADVLESLATEYPIAQKILSYRTLEKLRSTYIDALPVTVNPHTHRIHPTFNQWGTATGRLSCQDPNLQNIPVRGAEGKKIRTAFTPQEPGWYYLAADYSQIELRLLAHLSEDKNLLQAFQSGGDVHAYTASLVFNVPLPEVTKEMRFRAKAINFGIIYGQQAYGLSQELAIPMHEASAFIKAYFNRYPGVAQFIQHSIERAKKTGKSLTMLGREREIPEIHSTNAILRTAAERLAMNTPLQGSAADLIKKAMLTIDQALTQKKMRSFPILQIHDELIFEVPSEEVEELSGLVKMHMEQVFSLKVPLVVDVAIGKNWGEC